MLTSKTEEDTNELMNQFLSFRIRHGEKIADYKIRLVNLKRDLETVNADPQSICLGKVPQAYSTNFHRRTYVAGLRSNPAFNKALNAIKDVDQQTLTYIHDNMKTAQGDLRKRIQEIHGAEVGVSTVLNAVHLLLNHLLHR